MKALRNTQKFPNFIALNEAINTNKLDYMKECYQFDKEIHSDVLENTDRHFIIDTLKIIKEDYFVEGKRGGQILKEKQRLIAHMQRTTLKRRFQLKRSS